MATQAVERIVGMLPDFPAGASAATILAGVNAHERRGPKAHRVNYSLLRSLPNGATKAGAIAIVLKGIANGGESQTGLSQQYAMIADLTLGDGGYGPFDTDLEPLVAAAQQVNALSAADVDALRYAVPAATLEDVQEAMSLAAVLNAAETVQRKGLGAAAAYAAGCVTNNTMATWAGLQAWVAAAPEPA